MRVIASTKLVHEFINQAGPVDGLDMAEVASSYVLLLDSELVMFLLEEIVIAGRVDLTARGDLEEQERRTNLHNKLMELFKVWRI